MTTPGDQKFAATLLKYLPASLNIDWAGFAEEMNLKDGKVAKMRYSQIRRKISGANSGAAALPTYKVTKPTKATKVRYSHIRRKITSGNSGATTLSAYKATKSSKATKASKSKNAKYLDKVADKIIDNSFNDDGNKDVKSKDDGHGDVNSNDDSHEDVVVKEGTKDVKDVQQEDVKQEDVEQEIAA
ncbi:hypothetical protein M426DRAFT_319908 [Hypoxylon sp. CI-4A]|nr:hypothetical protein M426DRAFT_319908 [Hypoxylon sp. CI-4A]